MKKKSDESYEYYSTRVRNFGIRYNVSEIAICRYIVAGLMDDVIYDQLRNQIFKLAEDLIDWLNNAQAQKELEKQYKALKAIQKHKKVEGNSRSGKNYEFKKRTLNCYNCGSADPIARSCPEELKATKCGNVRNMDIKMKFAEYLNKNMFLQRK
jgi:RecA-family ATPase